MKKFFRKSLACIIAVMMIATSLPFSAITANADTVAGDKVLFAYFCGDDDSATAINQKIRLAVSEDGINFSPLNGNLPIISNTEGDSISFNGEWGRFAHTGGARDPFIFNKRNADGSIADGYYIVATDLCVNPSSNSYNNTKILVWDVASLDQLDSTTCTVIDTAGMYSSDVMNNTDAISWAPEIVWDYQVQKYALIWSASLWSSAKIHVAYTSDFKTFTTRAGNTIDGVNNFAEVLYTRDGYNFIDANINYENGKYYMVIKRENGGDGAKGVLYSVSASTLDGLNAVDPIRFYDSVNTGDPNGLEGPEVYQRPDGHWVLIADEYVKNPVCSFAMYDLGTSLETGLIGKGADYDHRQDLVTTNINSVKPRHGGVARISDADYTKLNDTYAGYNETSPGELIAKYFTTSGDVTADATGNGNSLTNNGVTMTTKDGKVCAYFNNSGKSSNDASAQYAYLPLSTTTISRLVTAKKGVTFTWNAYDLGNSGSYEEYANMFNMSTYTGNPGTLAYDGTNWTHNQHKISYLTSQLCSGISNGTQTSAGVQTMDVKRPAVNAWHSYKVVYGLNGMQVYRDNSLVKSYALDGINDSWINDVFSKGRLVFGASLFGTDMLFNGYINDFRIYSTSNDQNIRKINYPISKLTTINRTHLGVYAQGTRFNTNTSTAQIVNDAQNGNFSIGYATFDISGLSYGDLDGITATYSFNVALGSGNEELGLSVFYPTKNLDKFQTNGNAGTISDIWTGNDGLHKTRAKTYFGFNLIQMIQTYKGQSESVTVNITPAIIAAKKSGQSTATIAFMLTATGEAGNSNGWSDLDLSSFGATADVTISPADSGNEITGAIKYGPVIYTYGQNTVSTDYNYLKFGGFIASGDVKSATDCKTPVTLAQGVTVQSVTCLEDLGAILSIENNLLKGNFSCIYDGMVVTLKTELSYNGNTYIAYNKVYVDTIPVPAHAASMSQRYYGMFNPLKSIMAYSQTLKGSTGQNSTDGSSDGGQLKVNAKELYEPLAVTVRFDNDNDTNTWRLNSGIEGVLCDKFAGVTGYKSDGGTGKGTTTLTTVAPTGYYYYDKSTTDNYGFSSQNGNTFSFQLVTLPFKIVTGDNASQGNVNLDTHTLTGANFTQSDPYTTFSYDNSTGVPSVSSFTNTITGNASSITNGVMSGTYELRFANDGNTQVWAVNITKTNWNVYVADKSAARNPYNSVNSKILTSENISSTSWADYRTAYLNDEAFLSSYKNVADSDVQTKSTTYGNALTTAYNNLEYKVTVNYGDGGVDTAYLKKGNTIGIFGDMLLGQNSATVANNNNTHTTYSWDGLDGTVFDATVFEYYEKATIVDCSGGTATCVTKAVCDVCKAEYGDVDSNNHVNKTHYDEVAATCTTGGHSAYDECNDCHAVIGKVDYPALDHNYVYTYKDYATHTKTCSRGDIDAVVEAHVDDGSGKCSLCKGTLLDKTALNAAIATATPIVDGNNTDGMYVTESYNEFVAVYEKVTAANPTTQDEVNKLTAELTTATNTLRKSTLTVQLDKQVGETVTKGTPESCAYGESKEFTVTDGDVEKWEIITDNGTDQPSTKTYIKTGENTITLVITRNVTVTAHIATNSTSQQNITKVVFRGRNNSVVAIKYIEADEHLATAGVDIPKIPFYSADSWDKTEVIGLDNGGVITVRAQYTFNGQEADKCGIHFTGFDGGVKKFNYDSLVKLNNNSSRYFGMYEDEARTKLLTYFETDEFYAPHNSDIYVYALDSAPTTATVGVTGSYSGTDDAAGKKYAAFNCKFYVPDGATVLEWGIKASAGGQTRTFKSETKSRRNEYSLKVTFSQSSSISSINAQAYIIYKLGDTKETVLSNNTVTQNF